MAILLRFEAAVGNLAMMNRTLLRVPLHYREAMRTLPSLSNVPVSRPTIPTHSSTILSARRTLTSTVSLQSDQPSSTQPTSRDPPKDDAPPRREGAAPHVPWYLQEDAPASTSAEVSSREQLPELPEDPPAILPVLLEYTFKDLGLDDLRLFDLRALETPAALGANVIMIIGTARSVKHLNVSADRLCRWLRSNWKLSPYADGLLGRNELKIKLRRKARRLRIASRTGAIFDDKDDGITTGWICVNAGVVEEAPIEERENQGFEGFGAHVGGTRVVVQIFTEEKRAEVDLDGLWQSNLDRAERRMQKHLEASSQAPGEVRPSKSLHTSYPDAESGHAPRSFVSPPFEQRRRLHYSHRLGNFQDVDGVRRTTVSEPSATHNRDPSGSGITQGSLFQYLSELPDEKVESELGNGSDDRDSTLFLRLFYDSLSRISAEEAAIAQAELLCFAICRRHPSYNKETLFKIFMGCIASDYNISEDLGFRIVSALLTAQPGHGEDAPAWLPVSDKELALRVLDQLTLRGVEVLSLNMFNKLYTAAILPTSPGGSEDTSDGALRVSRMIDTLDFSFEPEGARSLMVSLFQNRDYDGFWKLWRKFPLNNSPRTYEDYELLFKLHADLGDKLRARDCLSAWVPMMRREDRPIPLQGPLLYHIMDCIVLVDPEIEHQVAEGSTSILASLWGECQAHMDD